MKSRGGWTEHGVFGDRTRCFDGWFDGRRDSRARAVSMDAETQWRMPCTLPSLKNTSWPGGEPPSDVTTHVRGHRIHDPFRSLHASPPSSRHPRPPPSPPPTPTPTPQHHHHWTTPPIQFGPSFYTFAPTTNSKPSTNPFSTQLLNGSPTPPPRMHQEQP